MDLSAIQRIEPATARGWPAARMDRIEGWDVFSGLGYVGRTNSCWPLTYEGSSVECSIDQVEAHYHALGLTPQFKLVTYGTDPLDLSDRLARRGYRVVSQVAVMTREGPMAAPEHLVDLEPFWRRWARAGGHLKPRPKPVCFWNRAAEWRSGGGRLMYLCRR